MQRIVYQDYPRLLVFSQVIPESRYAGSLALLRLLENYPADKLLVIGPAPHPESVVLSCRYGTVTDVPAARLHRTRFWRWKRSLAAFGFGAEVSVRDAERLAQGFRPDAVLTVMQESQYYCAASRYCSRNKLPLMILVHDLVELFESVHAWAESRQRRRNAAVYRSAAARFCVSPALARRLHEDYGAESTVLYPNRSEDLMPRPSAMSETLRTDKRLTIGYAGSLNYGYDEGVRANLPAFEAAGAVLRVYSPVAPEDLGEHLEYAGFSPAPMQTWERLKVECDAVVLPYAWSEGFRTLYETHFPSKLTEYLALGMPVLISGPAYAAGVAWGLRHPEAAMTVSEPSAEAMRAACVRLRDDAGLRKKLGSEAVRAGSEEFDPVHIRDKFLQKLREVAAQASDAASSCGSLRCD